MLVISGSISDGLLAKNRRVAGAMAEQERQRGLADEALQPDTRVWVKEEGEGSYERWQSSRFGNASHSLVCRGDSHNSSLKQQLGVWNRGQRPLHQIRQRR